MHCLMYHYDLTEVAEKIMVILKKLTMLSSAEIRAVMNVGWLKQLSGSSSFYSS